MTLPFSAPTKLEPRAYNQHYRSRLVFAGNIKKQAMACYFGSNLVNQIPKHAEQE
jgi:hypothetical protein